MTASSSLARRYLASGAFVAATITAGCGPGGGDLATELSVGPDTLSFRGTSKSYLEVDADGYWVATAAPSWLSIEPTEGQGDATITVTVNRADLEPDTYAGAIAFAGDIEAAVVIPVLMRWPEVDGNVHSPDGNLRPQLRSNGPAELRPGRDYVPGELLVGLDKQMVAIEEHGLLGGRVDRDLEPSAAGLQVAASRLGERVGARRTELISPALGLAKLTIDTPEVAAAVAEVRRDGRARYAEPNALMELHGFNDTHFELQWHYRNLKLEETWEMTMGHEDTVVAIIDADFHTDHPDLDFLPGYDFVRDTDNLFIYNQRCNAHATHVAGTVAAVTDNEVGVAGVAPNVGILPLNIAPEPDDPDAPPADVSCGLPVDASVRAIMYAGGASDPLAGKLERPVDVVNMSFGGGSPSAARAEALEFARDAGVVLISSAGNGGRDDEPITYPAANPIVHAIAATDQFDDRAPYSSAGPEVWVAAPGGNSAQTIPGTDSSAGVLSTSYVYDGDSSRLTYTVKNGTSMASPHAAGVAALVRSVNPDLGPDEVAEILAQTATDLGEPGRDEEYGYGLINAEAAVSVARDNLRIATDEVVVRLLEGDELLAETRADGSGAFELGTLEAGEYTIRAGSLRDGEMGVSGTVYGEQTITVDYSGDQTFRIAVSAR